MDRGRDDVRGPLAAQLHDVLAEVGLDHLASGRAERRVERDFLGRHRLALDHAACAALAGKIDDILTCLGRVGGDEHAASVGLQALLELDQQVVEARDRILFYPPRGVALGFVGGELGACRGDVIEMASGGVLEFAAQLGIGDRSLARGEEIPRPAGPFDISGSCLQLIRATWRVRRTMASRAASAAGWLAYWLRKL